jgi:hypothetical protein
VPAGLHLLWWTVPVLDLLVAGPALLALARAAAPRAAAGPAAASRAAAGPAAPRRVAHVDLALVAVVLLTGHAVLAGLGRPGIAAGVFGAVAALGFATAAVARRSDLGGPALVTGLLAVPATAWATATAFGAPDPVRMRVVLTVTVLLAVVPLVLRRYRRPVLVAVVTAVAPLPFVAAAAGESPAIYAAAGLLAVALATGRRPVLAAGVAATVALAFAQDAPWPVAPAAGLAVGLVLLLVAALRQPPVTVPLAGAVLAVPALTSLLDTSAATLGGLGAVLVAAAVAGATGRSAVIRTAGWVTAAAAATGFAVTVGDVAGFDPLGTAFLVLGVAAGTAVVAWVPLAGRGQERRAVEASAHAAAGLALLLASGSTGHAAVVCTLWGLVLGVRAVQQPAGWRRYLVAAAGTELAAWFLLLAAARVAVLEAYTIPAAAVALLAGMLARRGWSRTGRPLSSWVAFGPALAAALLPSLASVLTTDGQPLRRLLLGVAALGVVVSGANARLRAPVLLGGGVLALVAVQELGRVWDLVPRWIPLAAGGLLLVLLATTLERRRRDLDRFRAALHRMG